jgi:predicted transcriptional regulator
MAKQLTHHEIEEICRVYEECKNQIVTAKLLGHSSATVSKYLIANGYGCGSGGNPTQRKITDDEIIADIQAGYTRQEIADRHNVHVENLARRMKKLGVYATYAKHQKEIEADTWHYIESAKIFVENHQPDFEFIAYKRGRYKLKCKKCGNEIERAKTSIRRSKCCCEKCKDIKRQEEEREKLRSLFVGEYRKCNCCGKDFFAYHKTSIYCSESCKRKAKKMRRKERDPQYKSNQKRFKREKGYIARAKKYGCEYVYGITIKAVFKRDNGICKICGKPCDMNDRTYGDYGPNYPSVDHIIPLSRGGSHTWNNVQLAHTICNSYKRDLYTVKREEVWT